jgi:hypothetical protein
MDPYLQVGLTIAVPTFAVLLGSLMNNSRIADLNSRLGDFRTEINDKFKSFDDKMDARFKAVDARFDAIDIRFGAVDTRLTAIDHRITDTRDLLRAEIRRVEEVIDARLSHLEQGR